jgi:SAM-dependent methyltransferase
VTDDARTAAQPTPNLLDRPGPDPLEENRVLPLSVPVARPEMLLAAWMSSASGGDLPPGLLRLADGRVLPLPVGRWAGPVGGGDESMLSRVVGPVLDVGCGPGRLTAALHTRGTQVLGVELLPEVPVLARAAGAPLLLGNVFGPLPRPGSWRTVLLADGNIGIGGNPVRLLRRLRRLLAPGGSVLCELHPDPETAGTRRVRLEGLDATSGWFCWALLDAAGLPPAAAAAGLRVAESWEEEGRPFVALTAR